MNMNNSTDPILSDASLFPEFERFVTDQRLLENAKGALAAKLPRILGQGRTRAEGLDMPPPPIERRQELVAFRFPDGLSVPESVRSEIKEVQQQIDSEFGLLAQSDGIRRFATQTLKRLEGVQTGIKDNQFFAGRLVLKADKAGQNWSWCLTSHYPIISKIPPDLDYVCHAYAAAENLIEQTTLPVELFYDRLVLAWSLARHFSTTDDVLILNVSRMFKVAAQDERFWNTPARRNFNDIPDGTFIANLMNWRKNRSESTEDVKFEFVPATLSQAHGSNSKAFFMPVNPEGTQVRPVIYLRRSNKLNSN
jgi:hypothetical protein